MGMISDLTCSATIPIFLHIKQKKTRQSFRNDKSFFVFLITLLFPEYDLFLIFGEVVAIHVFMNGKYLL